MRIRSSLATVALAAGVVTAALLSAASALAAPSLYLGMQMGSPCVSGLKPTTDPITVKLLRSNGTVLQTVTDPSLTNDWSGCFRHAPVAGNKIRMTNGGTTRTVSVPDLTLSISRTTNVVSGHAPAGRLVTIQYHECYPAGCDAPIGRSATANSHGTYRKDLSSSIDIDGSDQVDVAYRNNALDDFTVTTFAPYVEISADSRIFVSCQPKGTRTVRLRTSDGTLRASTSFTATGDCSGFFGAFRKSGHKVTINTGNRVTSDIASDTSLVWPVMEVDGTTHQLSGRCLASSAFVVFITRNSSGTSASGITDGTGHLSLTLPGWTFQGGDQLDLICETTRGDHVRLTRSLPI